MSNTEQTIAVVGAGTMGAGIAQLAATHGCAVRLIDINRDVLDQGVSRVKQRLDHSADKGRITAAQRDEAMARIKAVDRIADLGDVSLAIEAVIENMDVKRKVFAELENQTCETAILATNTSSLSISNIAEAIHNRARVIGMHFFNPAPVMPLVEIISGRESDLSFIDRAFQTVQGWGKVPVLAKDTPGFIVNRVARGFYLEALRLLGEGVAGVDEIDAVMRTVGGFRMGPFELMDLVGLDVNFAVSTSVWQQMGKPPRFAPHDIQQNLVTQGHLGRKTKRGFYVYDRDPPIPAQPADRRSFALTPLLSDAMLAWVARMGRTDVASTEQYILCRILAAILNEAAFAYGESVASSGDIDLAMVKGTNYPKGPLAWADEIGHRTVRGVLMALNTVVDDDRYRPAPLFADAA